MDFTQQQRNPGQHAPGLVVVAAMHLALGWALLTGLVQETRDKARPPLQVFEVPPPLPPPPPVDLPRPQTSAPPLPSFVPLPEIELSPPPTPQNTITTEPVPAPPAPLPFNPAPDTTPVQAPVAAPPAPPVRVEPRLDFNRCAKPEYTTAARRLEAQGTVVVVYTMDTAGNISDAKIEKSSGPSREHKMLDRQTLEAVLACKGKPGSVDGKPETLTSRVSYVWKLE